jgi:acetyltransferase-like isoleucine patch superfamily enzyme
VVAEDLWVSDGLADAMKAAAGGRDGPCRLGRKADGPGRFADPLSRLPRVLDGDVQRIVFDVWYVPAGCEVECPGPDSGALPPAFADAPLIDIETRTYQIDLPVDPELLGVEELTLAAGAAVAAPISHWAEIVRTNLLAIGTTILGTSMATALFRLIWAAIRTLSLNPFTILGALTARGRRCKIHPTAVVEGCTLGDDVEIDAGAVLRGCLVGNGARIGAQAILEFTVVGERARVYRKAVANLSVIYPDARVGGIVQLGLMGTRAATKLYAVGTDMRLGGPVRVTSPDGLKSIDIGYHGVCFGHRSFVGSGVWIAPGRIIEADSRVVRDRALLVT